MEFGLCCGRHFEIHSEKKLKMGLGVNMKVKMQKVSSQVLNQIHTLKFMKIRCISQKPDSIQRADLPIAYHSSDFHVTVGKVYVVLGISFNFNDPSRRYSMVEIVNDYGHLSSVLLILFEIVDSHVSKYWLVREIASNIFTFWPPDFYTEYFHDDLSEDVPEVVERFAAVRKAIELESAS